MTRHLPFAIHRRHSPRALLPDSSESDALTNGKQPPSLSSLAAGDTTKDSPKKTKVAVAATEVTLAPKLQAQQTIKTAATTGQHAQATQTSATSAPPVLKPSDTVTSSASTMSSIKITTLTTSSRQTTTNIVTSLTANMYHTSSSTIKSSTSAAPLDTAATSTGTLVGGIGGAIVGIAVLSFLIAFFIRRWRKKRVNDERDFNTTAFRRSAVLLKDDAMLDYFSPGNGSGYPRPPTMIERHMVHTTNIAGLGAMSASSPPQYSPYGQYYHGRQSSFEPGQFVSSSQPPLPLLPAKAHVQAAVDVNAHYANVIHVEGGEQGQEASSYRHDNDLVVPGQKKRPDSVFTTIYNEEDAYGGM